MQKEQEERSLLKRVSMSPKAERRVQLTEADIEEILGDMDEVLWAAEYAEAAATRVREMLLGEASCELVDETEGDRQDEDKRGPNGRPEEIVAALRNSLGSAGRRRSNRQGRGRRRKAGKRSR